MATTIFTPLYEVPRSAAFVSEFFHAVRNIEQSADKRSVAKIHIGTASDAKRQVPMIH